MKITKENYNEFHELDGVPVLRASFIKQVLKTGSVAAARVPLRPSAAMELGTAVHVGLLEPKLLKRYRLRDWDLRSKEGKKRQAEVEGDGNTYIPSADYAKMMAMIDSCRDRQEIAYYLEHKSAKTEFPLVCKITGDPVRYCKSMIDLYSDKTLVDVKTTRSLHDFDRTLVDVKTTRSLHDFDRAFFDLYYDVQLAIYLLNLTANGQEVKAVKVIAVESEPPFQAQLIEVPDETIVIGFERMKEAFDIINKSEEREDPRVEPVRSLSIPGWILNRYRSAIDEHA